MKLRDRLTLLILLLTALSACGSDDAPVVFEPSPFLFTTWDKAITISDCENRNFPTTINHPADFFQVTLNDDLTYQRFVGGDPGQNGTYSIKRDEITFDPPLLTNVEITKTTYSITEFTFILVANIVLPDGTKCVITDRYRKHD